ncbi:MAG TPA: HD domain-containing protein [Burkholderiales bacterium]|nr:HD domain-containing protein [Burkholderiales bacterium]
MINEHELIRQTFAFVKNIHQKDFSGHDFEHIKRVWHNGQLILADENHADRFIVEMALLLHDVDDYKLSDNTERGYAYLKQCNLDESVIQRILTIIDSIGFSKTGYNPQFSDIETKIVYDADKLDAIGAFGIARAFAYGGAKSRPLFIADRLPPQNLDLKAYAANAKSGDNHTVIHFFEKLIRLPDLMQTERGKALAQTRKTTMINFLRALFAEQELDNWQLILDNAAN